MSHYSIARYGIEVLELPPDVEERLERALDVPEAWRVAVAIEEAVSNENSGAGVEPWATGPAAAEIICAVLDEIDAGKPSGLA